MSALPEDPGHFVAWRARQHPELMTEPGVFAPRVDWGRYLDETLGRHLRRRRPRLAAPPARARDRRPPRRRRASRSPPTTARSWSADAVVARHRRRPPGTPGRRRRCSARRSSSPDPWAPGALDVVRRDAAGPADVLLVGTGLTMVDVVLSLTGPSQRADRRVHAVSRHGELPERHADELQLAAIPEIDDWGDDPRRAPRPASPSTSPGCARADRRLAAGGRRAAVRASRRCGSGSARTTAPSSCATTPATGTGSGTGCPRLGRRRHGPRAAPRTLTRHVPPRSPTPSR